MSLHNENPPHHFSKRACGDQESFVQRLCGDNVRRSEIRTERGQPMKSISTALAIGVSALALAGAANAVTTVTLGEGTGWHYGESHAANSPKMYNYDAVNGSQFTLKAVVTNALDDLSFVDGYTPGDVYSIAITSGGGSFTAKTQFLDDTYFSPIPNLNAGPFGTTFGPDWLSSSYGHFQAQLTPGTYTI